MASVIIPLPGQRLLVAKDQWSVLPQLVCLENGTLLLSGGRPGLMLWVCTNGEGDQWHPVNLAEHHNLNFPDPELHFAEPCAEASGDDLHHTTSYTGMIGTGPEEVLVSYDRLGNGWEGAPGPWGPHDTVFTVQVHLAIRLIGDELPPHERRALVEPGAHVL